MTSHARHSAGILATGCAAVDAVNSASFSRVHDREDRFSQFINILVHDDGATVCVSSRRTRTGDIFL